MRFQTCLIVWHSKEPVLSVDFHPTGRLATGGADNTVKVLIWKSYAKILNYFVEELIFNFVRSGE
jgi:WD40 repeat protein